MKKKYFETCSCNPANGGSGICGCTLGNNEIDEYSGYTSFVTATTLWRWTSPERIDVIEFSDRIEFIYKETSMLNYSVSPPPKSEERVFKIVFSCVDGKWNKSDRIYGKIIPSQGETYEF